jgi:hypothetical protein
MDGVHDRGFAVPQGHLRALRGLTSFRHRESWRTGKGRAMIRRIALGTAFLAASVGWATASLAEGALAVGMPQGDPQNGLKWDALVDKSNPGPLVMTACRAAHNPRAAAACVLIRTFKNQCVAVAVNGDLKSPVSAAGWAIAPNSAKAIKGAIARCEAMRKGRGRPCDLDGGRAVGLRCDGKAK